MGLVRERPESISGQGELSFSDGFEASTRWKEVMTSFNQHQLCAGDLLVGMQ